MLANLKKLRETAGISQKLLADAIGVSQQSVNKYENHSIEPDIDTLIRIADYFGTSVDYLVGHTEIAHRIEPVRPFELNEEESEMVEKYRKLNARQRQSLGMVMDCYLKQL